jgi:hypothetical protein
MSLIVDTRLPNTYLKEEDGSLWEPPPELQKFLAWVFALEPRDYIKVRQFMSPIRFLNTACQVAQNPLLAPLFNHMVMEDFYAYRAAFTPPPGSVKQ